ncbi:13515_t:CDS:2 [Rhizophagus irregularis]|nr:13515_t:CDS:2 [Rhizophagus irregularis]
MEWFRDTLYSITNSDFDSPWLKKCAGCYKNISRNREDDVCLIHCNIGDELRSVKPFENLSDIIDKNNILITKKHKELNEDTKTEDVREAEFLLWLNYICVNKENFVWENFDELVNKWNDIDKDYLADYHDKNEKENQRIDAFTKVIDQGPISQDAYQNLTALQSELPH